jgi:hypothetical protein
VFGSGPHQMAHQAFAQGAAVRAGFAGVVVHGLRGGGTAAQPPNSFGFFEIR